MTHTEEIGEASGHDVDVVVIGSGFAGLYALHKLRNELGLNVRAFDNAGDVGGTWYWNRYPGARSDTEVTAYCYSFDRALFDEWKWNERYPRQYEILSYLNHVADRYDLRRSITFDTTIERALFDERDQPLGDHDERRRAPVGAVHRGRGRACCRRPTTRTSRAGTRSPVRATTPRVGRTRASTCGRKRVGVIGCGSSGVQLITEIAPQVDELFVFQRRPQYTVPARHSPIPREALEAINADYEDYWEGVLQSVTAFGFPESPVPAMSVSAEERERVFEEAWKIGGGFRFMFATFSDIGVDPRGERGGRRLHPAQDRPHRQGPEAGRLAHPVGALRPPPAVQRRVLRGLQPRQRQPGRPP